MRVGGNSQVAPPTYKYVLRPKGWVHEDGRVRTFTCDVERSVVVVLRFYTLHGQLVTTSKALTQLRRDIVSGDMTLKPSREDVCETFHAVDLIPEPLALPVIPLLFVCGLDVGVCRLC